MSRFQNYATIHNVYLLFLSGIALFPSRIREDVVCSTSSSSIVVALDYAFLRCSVLVPGLPLFLVLVLPLFLLPFLSMHLRKWGAGWGLLEDGRFRCEIIRYSSVCW